MFLTGKVYRDEYLHDMNICQEYAVLNRNTMADIILKKNCLINPLVTMNPLMRPIII